MRKAALFYNPISGRRKKHRVQDVEAVAAVLRAAGVELEVAPTRAASDATAQVRMAIREGFDTIIACGGDGTVHDVLQGIAGRDAALGIIPLGGDRRKVLPREGFVMFDEERVSVELVSGVLSVTQPREIGMYLRDFTDLARIAVHGQSARDLITEALHVLP